MNRAELLRSLRRAGMKDDAPAYRYLLDLAPGSRRAQLAALRDARHELGAEWARLTPDLVSEWKARMVDAGDAPATINRKLCALRGVLRTLGLHLATVERWAEGQRLCQLADSIKGVKGSRISPRHEVLRDELAALLHAAGGRDTRRSRELRLRDRAMVALLWGAGLRRDELVRLALDAYRDRAVVVRGKGNKERIVPVPPSCAEHLERWIAAHPTGHGAMFGILRSPARVRGGNVGWDSPERWQPLTTEAIYQRMVVLCARAGVRLSTPHDLRATYCTTLLDTGADLSIAADLMGHASVETTARYDHRSQRAQVAAASRLELPAAKPLHERRGALHQPDALPPRRQ